VAKDRPDSALGGPVREGLAEDRPEHCSEVRVSLGDKQPFYQRHQFAGQFVVGDLITDPVDLVIDFNELDGGRIEGYVLLGMLREKLPELNRPSIASQLQWLCDSLGVTWRDLYPPNVSLDRPRFIRTRNEIFHSNAPVDGAFVLRETYRVSALFERLILKVLGWTDLSATGSAGAEIPITDDL
jgi:hypothetical protein